MSLPTLAICIEQAETLAIAEALDPSFKKISYDTIKGWWLLINYPEQGVTHLCRPDDLPDDVKMTATTKIKVWTLETD